MNLHMLGAYYTKGQDCDLMFQKLKISKTERYRTHLNNHNVVFIDFSRMPNGCRNYEDYVKEKTYDSISEMFRDSKESSVSYEDLEYWCNGYYTATGDKLFNPRSVSKALTRGVCLNYWTETGPMNEIADCIENNTAAVREDIVKMVARIEVEVDLHGYSAVELQLNSRDEILSAMVVYCFLSYHDGYLRIPNHELMEKYQRMLARESMGEVKQIVEQSKCLAFQNQKYLQLSITTMDTLSMSQNLRIASRHARVSFI